MHITFEAIFQKLNEKKIRYLVVGGIAVNIYGYNRTTMDVDILLSLDQKNLKLMDEAMEELGYYPRIPVRIVELSDRKTVERYRLEKNLKAYTFTSSGQPPINMDIIIEESLEFEKFYSNKQNLPFQHHQLPVIGLNDLKAMKKKAGRDKDNLDLSALQAFHLDL